MFAAMARRIRAARRWHVAPLDPAKTALAATLARAVGVSPVCARILVRRGHETPEAAATFLSRNLTQLHDPLLLPDMQAAVARIAEAVEKGQKIVLFGDYDVDGLAATALLDRFFRLVKRGTESGFHVESYVPDRKDGYGLTPPAAAAILRRKPDLLITLDNGTSAHEHLADFAQAGIDCIVVDHHHVNRGVPPTRAVINPKRRDGHSYPFDELCGAGIAFKLAWALAMHFSHDKNVTPEFRAFLLDAMALAGAATMADVVPLVGENRVLAHQGLVALSRTRMAGLRALMARCNIKAVPRAYEVVYRIAPRLNAAGRCGDVREALELLLTDDPVRAEALAEALEGYNTARQGIEGRMLEEARAQALEILEQLPDCRALVLASHTWNAGVVGIVAARIVDEFHRPALLLSVDRERKVARGSGRSIRALHLTEALAATKEQLVRQFGELLELEFGGHAAAAGVTLGADKVAAFRLAFQHTAAALLKREDMAPSLHVDEEVTLDQVDGALCESLEKLEPCGAGNPRPMLFARGVSVASPPRFMGSGEEHFSFHVRQGKAARHVKAFNAGARFNEFSDLSRIGTLDLAFRPEVDSFRGVRSIEMRLEDFRAGEA